MVRNIRCNMARKMAQKMSLVCATTSLSNQINTHPHALGVQSQLHFTIDGLECDSVSAESAGVEHQLAIVFRDH